MGTFNDLLIEIGLSTKNAEKGLDHLERILEKSYKKQGNIAKRYTENSAKESAKVFKEMFSEKEKYAKQYNKEQVKEQNKVNKSAKESAAVFKKELEYREKSSKQQKVDNALKSENLRLSKQLLSISGKEANINKELPLQKQNALLEKQIRLYKTRNMRADNQLFNIQSRSSFQGLSPKQQRSVKPRFDQAKAEFMLKGDTRVFKILNEDLKTFKRNLSGLSTVQNGITDSTRNMVRSYASLFALVEGTRAIEQAGIEFQGMSVAMLSSSGGAKKAAEDLKFINDIADKTGNDLKSITDSYVKMQFALKGKIPDEQFKEFFTNTNKLFTSLKLTKVQAQLAGKALQQMANKNQVMSEELKGQLAESLPGAVQIFSDALGVGTEKLFDMMQKGQVNFQKILPKLSEQFKKVAENGGAYEAALNSLIVTKGRFGNEVFKTQNKIFQSGFEEGMSELYKTMTQELKSTGKSQEDLGKIYKNFFKALAQGIKLVTPLVEALIQSVSLLTDAAKLSLDGWKMLYEDIFLPLPDTLKSVTLAITAVGLAMNSVIAKGVLLLGTFQEIASLFDDKLVGVLESRLGSQFNFRTMQQTGLVKRDGQFFSEGKPTNMLDSDIGKGVTLTGAAAGMAALVFSIKKLVGAFNLANTAVRGFSSKVNSVANIGKTATAASSASAFSSLLPATALAAPVAYSAFKTNQNKDSILEQVRSGGLGSRAQRALLRADQAFMNNPSNIANQVTAQAQSSKTNYVTLSPEINVTIEGSGITTETAGSEVANSVMGTLEEQLSNLIKGGRK